MVKKGDTVSRIAKNFHTSAGKIKEWNQLKNVDKIYPGQKLRVG
ncbi:LysM domain-containing protein [Niallia circulans]